MFILLNKLNITPENIQFIVRSHNLERNRVVFIFPGNPTHHTAHSSLFSVKTGAGLAAIAYQLSMQGMPTLSLPTYHLSSSHKISLTQNAIRDLWRALGYGCHFILPVRQHSSQTCFDTTHCFYTLEGLLEPRFYKGVSHTADREIANMYLMALAKLNDFIKATPETKKTLFKNLNPLYQEAYQEGLNAKHDMKKSNLWFSKASHTPTPFLKELGLLSFNKAAPLNKKLKPDASQIKSYLISPN